ncbi:phasin family protein [Pontivivens ytuae]|uniref:Phasin family protein n=1 Tax=Pontivivens ytuae TaxID=2789856 RepID=A0A7S9LQ32_9RHOB|nr:phasin family protein [Pontivivens ytuae]QPH52885.1 phasin family protein [Pontivivens ytuae]
MATTKTTAKDAAAQMESFAADAQKTMTDTVEKMTKGFEEASSFGQENLDAMVKSGEIAAKAAEGFGNEVSSFTKRSFEESVAAAKDMASAKTMTELFEKQSAFAQSMFDGWMKQTTKMNEMMMAAAKDVSAPMGERMTAATSAMKSMTA